MSLNTLHRGIVFDFREVLTISSCLHPSLIIAGSVAVMDMSIISSLDNPTTGYVHFCMPKPDAELTDAFPTGSCATRAARLNIITYRCKLRELIDKMIDIRVRLQGLEASLSGPVQRRTYISSDVSGRTFNHPN
jgi:hypothetical protein